MCEYYCKCDYCANESESYCDRMGDGSPFCSGFSCTVSECKYSRCISIEEEMECYGY